jgi:hypothetical protein
MNAIAVVPNPNNGFFEIIGLEKQENYSIEISDVSGKTVYKNEMLTTNNIDLRHCSNGFYFVRLSNSKGMKVIKFVIEK